MVLFEECTIRVARDPEIGVCKGWQKDLPEGLETVDDFGSLASSIDEMVKTLSLGTAAVLLQILIFCALTKRPMKQRP